MDPFIDIGNSQVRLSALRHDASSRARCLSGLYRSASSARCMCTELPVEMGVAKRNEAPGIYYLYHLHRTDPTLHHPQCPHRIEQTDNSSSQKTEPADNRPSDSSNLVVHTPLLEPRPIRPPGAATITGLGALLEAVVHSAGLDIWHPGFITHRSYFQARFRLIEASKRIRPFGSATLADILFIPPTFDKAKRDDLDFEWKYFLDQLQPTQEMTIPRGVVMGRVRSVQFKDGWSAPRIQLSESNLSLWLDNCPKLIPQEPTEEFTWLVLLAVEVSPETGKLKVIDGAAMRITPQWLPVFTPAHAALANDLVSQKLSFVSSLLTVSDSSWAVPDLILTTKSGPPQRVFPAKIPAQKASVHS